MTAVNPLLAPPELAARFGAAPTATTDPLAAQAALATAVANAPNLPQPGAVDPNVPMGLPPLGTPIAQVQPDPAAAQLAAQQTLPVIPAPAAPVAPPVGGGGVPAGPDQMAPATAEVKAAGQEATQVGQSGVEVAKQGAEDLAKADQMRADEAEAAAGRLTALQKRQETAYNESKAQFDQAKQDVSNFKFHDFFSNQSFAREALAGIGMLLGGASYDSNHVNTAIQVVQSAIKNDSDRQLAYLHSKEHLAELSQQGVRDTQAYLAHEMANFQTAEALKKEAVARQIDTLSSTTRGKQNIVAARQVAAGLRESAAKDAQSAILQGTHNRVMQSQIGLNNANAAHARAAAGAVTGTKQEVAAEKVVKDRLAANKTVTTLLKEKEELDKANSASVPDPKTGRVNGTAFQAAVDGFTKAITGLGARKGSIDMTTGAMGGLVDRVKRNIQKGVDGEYTAHDVQVFRQGLDKIQRGNSLSLKTSRKIDEQAFAGHPLTKSHKDVYMTALDQRYGDANAAEPAKPASQFVGTREYKLGADGLYH